MELRYMKKYDNFLSSLDILKRADFSKAGEDEIYRTGIVGQFNLAFELAWKALQAVLQLHSVANAETGSPREILKLAYKTGFIQNDDVWLTMLKKRNSSVHIYNEEEIDELIRLIRDSFIPVLDELAKTLKENWMRQIRRIGINEDEKVFYMLHSGLTFAGGITCHTGAGIIITERLRCII